MKGTTIKVHPTEERTTRGSKFQHLPPTPLRGLVLGPSGSGKTVVLVDMILRLYRGAFERIYVFSPSVHIDSTWVSVKDYIEKDLKIDGSKDPFFFDTWDNDVVKEIVETQRRVIEESKKQKIKQLYWILVVVDDFADDPKVVHSGGSILNSFYTRG